MLKIIIKGFRYLLLLVLISVTILVISHRIETRNHVSRFDASYEERKVVPYLIKEKDGTLFTGKIYDTYFGDRLWGIKEWEGTYENGIPSGEFNYFSPEGKVKHIWQYENGVLIKHLTSQSSSQPSAAGTAQSAAPN